MTFDVTESSDTSIEQVVCANCRTVCDKRSNFCSRCGQRLQLVESEAPVKPGKEPRSPREFLQHLWWGRRVSIFLPVLLALVVLNGSFLLIVSRITLYSHTAQASTAASAPNGVAWFYDGHSVGDAFALRLSHLPMLPPGKVYVGWLHNPYRPDQLLSTGSLSVRKNGSATFFSTQSASFNTTNQDLRLIFTYVDVTVETGKALPTRPMGQVVLHGAIAAHVVQVLAPLFVSASSTPRQVALLAGFSSQLHEIDRWVTNMHDTQMVQDNAGIFADLLRIVYILEGKNGPDVQKLNITALNNIQNEGDGFGVLAPTGYLAAFHATLQTLVAQHAIAATTLSHVQTALTTISTLAHTMLQVTLKLVANATLSSPTSVQMLNTLSQLNDALLYGRDLDGDGRIDPVPGEAAAAQLYTYMQALGAITLQH